MYSLTLRGGSGGGDTGHWKGHWHAATQLHWLGWSWALHYPAVLCIIRVIKSWRETRETKVYFPVGWVVITWMKLLTNILGPEPLVPHPSLWHGWFQKLSPFFLCGMVYTFSGLPPHSMVPWGKAIPESTAWLLPTAPSGNLSRHSASPLEPPNEGRYKRDPTSPNLQTSLRAGDSDSSALVEKAGEKAVPKILSKAAKEESLKDEIFTFE